MFSKTLFGAYVCLAEFAIWVLPFFPKLQSILKTVVTHAILLFLEPFIE
jgi:hypothetical protein